MTPVDIDEPPPEGYAQVTFAKDQPEYLPLPAWVEREKPEGWHGAVITRWRPTAEELEKIVAGDDLCLEVWTFGQRCPRCRAPFGLQPVKLGVWSDRVACVDGSLDDVPPQ